MIAIPPELLERYPQDPRNSVLPERPWWHFGLNIYRKLDGVRPTEDRMSKCKNQEELLAAMAEVDVVKPLPHPGIRVGQTWALVYRNLEPDVFTITDYDTGHMHTRYGMDIVYPWFIGSHWIPDDELREVLKIDSILLSDTCCPHLAPWSTVKYVRPERMK